MLFSSTLALVGLAAAVPEELSKRAEVKGFDVSHYQPNVDFKAAYNTGGLRFVYIKATEGTTYKVCLPLQSNAFSAQGIHLLQESC